MDQKLTDYLIALSNKMENKNELRVVYSIYGNRIIKIGSHNTNRGAMEVLKEYLNEYEVEENDQFLIISHAFSTNGKFLHGPMILSCTVISVRKNGNIIRSSITTGIVHYLPKELKNRGFLKGDYRRLYKKIKSEEIEPGMKKWYSAKHLD